MYGCWSVPTTTWTCLYFWRDEPYYLQPPIGEHSDCSWLAREIHTSSSLPLHTVVLVRAWKLLNILAASTSYHFPCFCFACLVSHQHLGVSYLVVWFLQPLKAHFYTDSKVAGWHHILFFDPPLKLETMVEFSTPEERKRNYYQDQTCYQKPSNPLTASLQHVKECPKSLWQLSSLFKASQTKWCINAWDYWGGHKAEHHSLVSSKFICA